MTTGEFEFDTIFLNTHDDSSMEPKLYFPGASYFLWVVFIILMPVLFNNLLVHKVIFIGLIKYNVLHQYKLQKVPVPIVQVGLAVGDTAAERARATLTKLGLQVLKFNINYKSLHDKI